MEMSSMDSMLIVFILAVCVGLCGYLGYHSKNQEKIEKKSKSSSEWKTASEPERKVASEPERNQNAVIFIRYRAEESQSLSNRVWLCPNCETENSGECVECYLCGWRW